MSSNRPVISSLATGSGDNVALSAPSSPESEYLVGDFTGTGFDAATLTNTSSRSIAIDITTLANSRGAQAKNTEIHLAGSTSVSVHDAVPALSSLRGVVMIVKASRPTLVVTLALPTRPAGMTVVGGLDGR
jgi:hypothetical protein